MHRTGRVGFHADELIVAAFVDKYFVLEHVVTVGVREDEVLFAIKRRSHPECRSH